MNITKSVILDAELWQNAKDMNLNVSYWCNEGLKIGTNSEQIQDPDKLRAEADLKMLEVEKARERNALLMQKRTKQLEDFMTIKPNFSKGQSLDSLNYSYWSNITGKTEDELREIKRKQLNY